MDLPHSFRRRAYAGVQMGIITAMLVPLFTPPSTTIAATFFMLPFLGGFLYDWFLVTGRIDAQKGAEFFERILHSTLMQWTPLLLRLLTAAGLIYFTYIQPINIFIFYDLPIPSLWITLQFIIIFIFIFFFTSSQNIILFHYLLINHYF